MVLLDVPLFLIPNAVRKGVQKYHGEVERIVVRRIKRHRYNVSVHSRSIKRELRPSHQKTISPAISPGHEESVA